MIITDFCYFLVLHNNRPAHDGPVLWVILLVLSAKDRNLAVFHIFLHPFQQQYPIQRASQRKYQRKSDHVSYKARQNK